MCEATLKLYYLSFCESKTLLGFNTFNLKVSACASRYKNLGSENQNPKIWANFFITNTKHLMPGARFELATRGFSVLCSTD